MVQLEEKCRPIVSRIRNREQRIGSALLLTISQLIRGEVAVWYATILGLVEQASDILYLKY
ncbi:hypothetical protein HUJ04_010998 [Dendroctonus ponderosae]|nr:hypothetical protein HUJ04_010998 [Dendroctonus ponderosae]